MNQEPRFPDLILASSSAARKALLERLQIPFETVAANIDESPLEDETPATLVERLSIAKAARIGDSNPQAWVIGSDQAALHRGLITGKPGRSKAAVDALKRFSGDEVVFLTGLALVNRQSGRQHYLCDRTMVTFRDLDEDTIRRYVERDRPLDCAGSFRLESLGPTLFTEVRTTDPTALLGLPLIGLSGLLRKAGFQLP